MNKHLIALAVATAFTASSAMADVEVGSFAIYGSLHSAVESIQVNGSSTATTGSQERLMDQTSRLGFKTKYSIDGDLTALAQIESRLYLGNAGSANDNKTELGSRNTFVGLGSKTFGTIRLGRYDNAYKLSLKQSSSTFYGNLNDASKDYESGSPILGRLAARQGDIVAYESPNWSGLTANASYNMGKDGTNTLLPQISMGVGYASDSFTIGYGRTTLNNQLWNMGTDSKLPSPITGFSAANQTKITAQQLGGQYTFGAYSIGAVYENTTSTSEGATNLSQAQDTYGLVGGYKEGKLEVQVRYALAKDVTGTTTKGTGATQVGVTAAYELSKNVKVVGSYTALDNDTNSEFTTGSGFTTVSNADLKILAMGLNVSF